MSGSKSPLWLPYVAPMALFMVLTTAEAYAPRSIYVWLYLMKTCAVSGSLFYFRDTWKQEIRRDARVVLPALLVGIAVFAEWVLLDRAIPYPHLGARTALNPFIAISAPSLRALFLAARLYGLAVMVPVMEELFWRSFLLRYLTDPDFKTLPIGSFSWTAFAIVAAFFGAAHPEWLVAAICAVAYGLLLWRTRSLFACIVAHGITNLMLGIYVLWTGAWQYW